MKPGDSVTVKKLKKVGTISEVRSDGSFRVTIGALSMTCAEEDLAPSPRGESRTKPPSSRHESRPVSQKFNEELDLHGLTVVESINLLESFVDRALMANADRVKIIHGLGTGKVKAAVHQWLSSTSAVKHHAVDPLNAGVTWAYF